MPTSTPRRRTRLDLEQVREQVLAAFSLKAKRFGLRALLMTELAAELRMSATTLYRLFPSKEALALACVERWANELGAAEAAKRDPRGTHSGFDQYMHWLEAWADANAALSPAFARDLKSDYPAVWQRYRDVLNERKRRGAELLSPLLKPDVDARVAFALLNRIFSLVLDPEFADRLQVSRKEAIRGAVSIWASGALARRGELRTLKGGRKT
ncbi:MAG TPA: TetR/AcrR family transcriptional regulator [Polyangiales bacterium]|nr:TetR/AcrR family transcriptional regulator [Polyangiales bacterium]